jgi:hypothetical protein
VPPLKSRRGPPALQSVEEGVERPTNPKVLLDILFGSTKTVAGTYKQVVAVLLTRGQYGLEAFCHRLLELLALLMIGAGGDVRLKGFRFSSAGGASAFACRSRSRTIIRIHSGSADRPLRKSS